MTRARRAAKGLVTPPPLHRWMEAVLLLCVSLVQGVATTFGMRFNRQTHDWHMDQTDEALPQTKPDIHLKDPLSGPPGSCPAVNAQRRTQTHALSPAAAQPTESSSGLTRGSFLLATSAKQDARVRPAHDPGEAAAARTSPPPPNGGGAARTPVATRAIRWGTALTTRPDRRGRRQTVPHLSCAPCEPHARISSPVRGRMRSAHA